MFTATILTVCTTIATIIIHFETISLLERYKDRFLGGPRTKVIAGMFVLFAAHALEIWLFAAAIFIAIEGLQLGGLNGAFNGDWADYLYISVVTYASVGYGDIQPTENIRTICGFEALTGIMMMAWSASYAVYNLQDRWR